MQRFIVRGVGIALAVLLLTAAPATAATGPGAYGIVPQTGIFTPLTTNNLLPAGGIGRQLFYLSTTGTGIKKLPFPLKVYNQSYKNIAISGNGNVQLGITSPGGNATEFVECLPTASTTFGPAVMPLWGELGYGGGSTGVFLRTQGTAPHRTFTVSWQGVFEVTAPTSANAQVTFREDSQTITFTYGETTLENNVTIGIQSKQQLSYTQRYCVTRGRYPTAGTQLKLVHVD